MKLSVAAKVTLSRLKLLCTESGRWRSGAALQEVWQRDICLEMKRTLCSQPETLLVSGQESLDHQVAYALVTVDGDERNPTVSDDFLLRSLGPAGDVLTDLMSPVSRRRSILPSLFMLPQNCLWRSSLPLAAE